MRRSLENPALLRRLAAACRRTGAVSRWRWWTIHRRTPLRHQITSVFAAAFFRLLLSALIACGGLALADQPMAAQLLSIVGLASMQARILQLRSQLGTHAHLAVFAQFPLPAWQFFDHQLRPIWRASAWSAIDAAGFWAIAWATSGHLAPWAWLPAVALAHALVSTAMAFMLVRLMPNLGLLVSLIVGTMTWGTLASHTHPQVWSCIKPAMEAVAWLTPWGWVNDLASSAPTKGPLNGMGELLIVAVASLALYLSFFRLRGSWRIDPPWRLVAGRPPHTWNDSDDEDVGAINPPTDAHGIGSDAGLPSPASRTTDDQAITESATSALARARHHPAGLKLLAFGWVGQRALAALDKDDRWLVDLLSPVSPGSSAWRWALLLSGLPAACVLSGISCRWGAGALIAILLVRRMPRRAAAMSAIVGSTFFIPPATLIGCNVLLCAMAILMAVPIAGGFWQLPIGSSVVGHVPRSWSRLMRIMLTLTGWRLLSAMPIVGLAVVAIGAGLSPDLGALIAGAWVAIVLATPWLTALRLIIPHGADGIHLGLGRPWITFANLLSILLHAGAVVLLAVGIASATISGTFSLTESAIAAAGMVMSLVVSALQLPLLRHAYRRSADFIPPL